MPRQTLSLLLVLVLWIATPVAAQNLLSQLPIDGTSARFLMEFKTKGEDQEMTATGTLNISSVG